MLRDYQMFYPETDTVKQVTVTLFFYDQREPVELDVFSQYIPAQGTIARAGADYMAHELMATAHMTGTLIHPQTRQAIPVSDIADYSVAVTKLREDPWPVNCPA